MVTSLVSTGVTFVYIIDITGIYWYNLCFFTTIVTLIVFCQGTVKLGYNDHGYKQT